MSFTPKNKKIRIPKSSFSGMPGVTFLHMYETSMKDIDPSDDYPPQTYWYATKDAIYRSGSLREDSQEYAANRARKYKRVQSVEDLWPDQPRLRFTYVTDIKKGGETFLVYRHRNVIRHVPESAQSPRILYGSVKSAGEDTVLLSSGDDTERLVKRIGRYRIRRSIRNSALVDQPDINKASLLVMPVMMPIQTIERTVIDLEASEVIEESKGLIRSPKFRRWFEGSSDEMRNEDDSPKVFFRGQVGTGSLRSRLSMDSFVDNAEIASVYATRDGDIDTVGSNIMPVFIDIKNPLVIELGSVDIYSIIRILGYGEDNGITHDEVTKMLVELVRRKKASSLQDQSFSIGTLPKRLRKYADMPSFNYQVKNEEDTEDAYSYDEDDLIHVSDTLSSNPLASFTEAWSNGLYEGPEYLERLSRLMAVDVYAVIDTSTAKKVMGRMGYDGVIHKDIFSAGDATKSVLGKDIDDIDGIDDGEDNYDWEDLSYEHGHYTVRPLDRSQIWPILSSNQYK